MILVPNTCIHVNILDTGNVQYEMNLFYVSKQLFGKNEMVLKRINPTPAFWKERNGSWKNKSYSYNIYKYQSIDFPPCLISYVMISLLLALVGIYWALPIGIRYTGIGNQWSECVVGLHLFLYWWVEQTYYNRSEWVDQILEWI